MSKKTVLTREAILAASDLPQTQVEVPEWGGVVTVQCLSGTDLAAWQDSQGEGIKTGSDGIKVMVSLIIRCALDADGNRLFTDAHTDALMAKGMTAFRRVFRAALKVNALTRGEVEVLEKN